MHYFRIFWFSLLLTSATALNADAQWVRTTSPPGFLSNILASSSSTLFAGTDSGLYRSTDTGMHWTALPIGPATYWPLSAIIAQNGEIFAATHSNGVIRSLDNGTTWTPMLNGLDSNVRVYAFASFGWRVYAGTAYSGVIVTSDAGASWVAVNAGLPNYGGKYPHPQIAVLYASAKALFASPNSGGIFRSTDAGISWQESDSGGLAGANIAAFASNGSDVFALTTINVFRSSDGGVSWNLMDNSSSTPVTSPISVVSSTLFANDDGVAVSSNNGRTWKDVSTGLQSHPVSAFAVSGANLFAVVDYGLWRRPLSEMIDAAAQAHDISAVAVLQPAPSTRTPVAIPTEIIIRFTNSGMNDEVNVPVSAVVRDSTGHVVSRTIDTVRFWPSGSTLDTTFEGWVPNAIMAYTICGIALLPNDGLRANDTTCATAIVGNTYDGKADGIANPQEGDVKAPGTTWQPVAYFRSIGAVDLFEVPTRFEIRGCSDGLVYFRADSIIPTMNNDQGSVAFAFPAKQGPYDTKRLTPGCYRAEAIAQLPSDGDRSNDTAWCTFSVGNLGVVETNDPGESALSINPNPVETSTAIRILSSTTGVVEITIHNLLGTEVARLFSGELGAGEHSFTWDARGLPPGMYECVVRMGGHIECVPMVLTR